MRLVVFSGAGMSAESGVPTFRDAETGLWANVDPYEMSSTDGWRRHPERVWAWYLWRHHLVKAVEPNDGHRAVAGWADAPGTDVDVITQNVDDLHERAGSARVSHLHGSITSFRCDTCGAPYLADPPAMPEPIVELDPPRCGCSGLIRPDVVWFGEALPAAAWEASVAALETADAMLVVGTSSVVHPAAMLPELALERGIPVVEVNPVATPFSERATAVLRETAATALPGLTARLPELIDGTL